MFESVGALVVVLVDEHVELVLVRRGASCLAKRWLGHNSQAACVCRRVSHLLGSRISSLSCWSTI